MKKNLRQKTRPWRMPEDMDTEEQPVRRTKKNNKKMCEKQEHTVPTARKKNISITERLSSTVSHSRKVKHSLSPEKKKKQKKIGHFRPHTISREQ